MGNCHNTDDSAADRTAEASGEEPVLSAADEMPLGSRPVPLWMQQVEERRLEEAMAAKQREEEKAAAEKAAEEAAAKKAEEDAAATKAEEANRLQKAVPKKRASAKKLLSSKTRAEGDAAELGQGDGKAMLQRAPEASDIKLDKLAVKERENAFKDRPEIEQNDLGNQIQKAAREGNAAELERLLESGVPPDLSDQDGWVPLMGAAHVGSAECVSILLKYGANPKSVIALGEWGMSALHYAARNGHMDAAVVLAPVSDCKGKNFQGKTAAETAKDNGHTKVAKVCK